MASVRHILLAYNSVYLVEAGGERVLIDTGPDYRGAKEMLATAVAGQQPSLVVATHGHLDHAGLGHWWQDQGIPVALHGEDLHYSTGHQLDDAELRALEGFVRECGAPPNVEAEALAGLATRRAWARRAVTTRDYRPAGRDARWPTGLRYEPFEPRRVLVDDVTEVAPGVPGGGGAGSHPGNLVVFIEAEGWLFSGDQLLPEITPTPSHPTIPIGADGTVAVSQPARFLDSRRQIRQLGATRCYPGHGSPFEGWLTSSTPTWRRPSADRPVLEALRETSGGTLTDWRGAQSRALRKRFWQIFPRCRATSKC